MFPAFARTIRDYLSPFFDTYLTVAARDVPSRGLWPGRCPCTGALGYIDRGGDWYPPDDPAIEGLRAEFAKLSMFGRVSRA